MEFNNVKIAIFNLVRPNKIKKTHCITLGTVIRTIELSEREYGLPRQQVKHSRVVRTVVCGD
jgi:hypothetical protein